LKIKSIIEVMWGCEVQGAVRSSCERCSGLPGSKRRDFLHHQALISLSSRTAIYSQ